MIRTNEIKTHKHIVFCNDHYNPLGIVRSLGEYGIKSIVIAVACSTHMIKSSKYVQIYHDIADIDLAYKLLLDKYGNESVRPFLYTADDEKTSYLDRHYSEIKEKFYFFNAGQDGQITRYMDKDNINQLAVKHGLKVLDTVKVKKGVIPNDLQYPIITKSISPIVGGWKKDVFICHNTGELEHAYKRIQAPIVLLQRYIEKKNELCLDGFACNKGKDVFFGIASNYNYILPDTYSWYMRVFNFKDDKLKRMLKNMFEEIGFEGVFSVEFLVDQTDELFFCEINFRNSTWSYASTCAGMNLPVLWARCMCGEIPFNNEDFTKEILGIFNAMVEVSDFRTRVLPRKVGIFKWISDFKNANCKFYCAKGDLKPVITCLMKHFRK